MAMLLVPGLRCWFPGLLVPYVKVAVQVQWVIYTGIHNFCCHGYCCRCHIWLMSCFSAQLSWFTIYLFLLLLFYFVSMRNKYALWHKGIVYSAWVDTAELLSWCGHLSSIIDSSTFWRPMSQGQIFVWLQFGVIGWKSLFLMLKVCSMQFQPNSMINMVE